MILAERAFNEFQGQRLGALKARKRAIFMAPVVTGMLALSSTAFAQAVETPPASAVQPQSDGGASTEDSAGLGEIVVTAQRRNENLQSVPVSVSAFGAAELAQRNITDMTRLDTLVPGFTFSRSGTDARPSMRGVRTDNVGVNGDTTIGFFIDGIYQSRSSQALAGFVDVAQVEVQRGPQGTLYGRNTFGGNIAVTTQEPRLGKVEGAVNAIYGSYDRVRVEGVLNLPLGDYLAARFAGAYEHSDGWVENDNPSGNNLFDDDNRYIRGSILFEPEGGFRAVLRADYNRQKPNGASAFGYKQGGTYIETASCQQLFGAVPLIVNARPGNRDGIADCTPANGGAGVDLGVPIYKADDPYRIDTDYRTFTDLEKFSATLDMSYDVGPVTLKSITGYVDFKTVRTADSDFSGNTIAIDSQRSESETFSQEVQLLSNGGGPLKYVVGAYYFRDDLVGNFINQQVPRVIRRAGLPDLNLAIAGGGSYDRQEASTRSIAAYAQATYEVADRLRFTLGGRYTRDRKTFRFANAALVLPRVTSATGVVTPDLTAITIGLGEVPAESFGKRGTTNCTFAGAVSGFACAPYNTGLLVGATYEPETFKQFTYRAAVDFDITDRNLLYASFSTGFRSGGFNSGQAAAQLAATFDPEKVKALEIGSKNRFFDNTLQVNLSAYYNWYSNLQEQRAVPVGNTTISGVFNAARARAYGLEAEVLWQPVPELTIQSAFAYINAKYTEFPDTPLPFGTSVLINGTRVFAPGYNCRQIPGSTAFGCDISGNEIPHQPSWSGNMSIQYEIPLGGDSTLTPYAAVQFSDGYFGTPFNSGLDRQGSFAKVDLRLTYAINAQYSLQAFVDNLTDNAVANRFVFGAGALQKSYAPPRLWGLRASAKF